MSNSNTAPNPGRLARIWRVLRSPSASYSLLVLLTLGFFSGIVFWGGSHTVLAWTNTEAFCISCHEMRDNVFTEEYKKSIHYTNRIGVRAVCADCHVPKEWGPMMVRKIAATRELYGKVVGSIDTPEKFAAQRLRLAEREWRRMRANDSMECRDCHELNHMDPEKKNQRARRSHLLAQESGETCIDCHQGIAHPKPDDMIEAFFEEK